MLQLFIIFKLPTTKRAHKSSAFILGRFRIGFHGKSRRLLRPSNDFMHFLYLRHHLLLESSIPNYGLLFKLSGLCIQYSLNWRLKAFTLYNLCCFSFSEPLYPLVLSIKLLVVLHWLMVVILVAQKIVTINTMLLRSAPFSIGEAAVFEALFCESLFFKTLLTYGRHLVCYWFTYSQGGLQIYHDHVPAGNGLCGICSIKIAFYIRL